MPASLWFAIVTAIIALVAVAATAVFRRAADDLAPVALLTALVSGALTVLLVVVASVNIVGTRQVGIATSFGRPTGATYGNGLHFTPPWVEVHEMDGAVQIDTYEGDRRIAVRLGNNSTALADASIRWQIEEHAAPELFQQYKTFDGVRVNLIERNLRVALNEAFAAYDPLDKKNLEESPLPGIAAQALTLLRSKVGDQVEILDVSVPTIDFDDKTEDRINQVNAERAKTTAAAQEVLTNEQKRLAAEKLAGMAPPDLRIAIANCVNKMAESGQSLNCYPIGGNALPTIAVPNPGQ